MSAGRGWRWVAVACVMLAVWVWAAALVLAWKLVTVVSEDGLRVVLLRLWCGVGGCS